MKLKKLGFYKKPLVGTSHDLREYAVDAQGQVWSANDDTYETRYGKEIREGQGFTAVATMRDVNGKKVSIVRKKLIAAFNENRTSNF